VRVVMKMTTRRLITKKPPQYRPLRERIAAGVTGVVQPKRSPTQHPINNIAVCSRGPCCRFPERMLLSLITVQAEDSASTYTGLENKGTRALAVGLATNVQKRFV